MSNKKIFEVVDDLIEVRMLDSWGIAKNYKIESICPSCGNKWLVNRGKIKGKWDGVHTYIHEIGCTKGCSVSHQDLKRINSIID